MTTGIEHQINLKGHSAFSLEGIPLQDLSEDFKTPNLVYSSPDREAIKKWTRCFSAGDQKVV